MASTLSFLVSSRIPVTEEVLRSLVGRDELVIQAKSPDENQGQPNVIGSMTIDVEESEYKDEECLFVCQSTAISLGNGFEHVCNVTGFVNFQLDTLEERRVILARSYEEIPTRPLFRNGDTKHVTKKLNEIETVRSILSSPTEEEEEEEESQEVEGEEGTGCASADVKDADTSRLRTVYVSEWRRRNGQVDPDHSAPMNVPIECSREFALMTDSSLILAEKLLSKLGLRGRYVKLNTLDKRCWTAPITLRVTKLSYRFFNIVKTSPIDQGTTESTYNSEGCLLTRTITTTSGQQFSLTKCEDLDTEVDIKPWTKNDIVRRRIFEEKMSRNLLSLQKTMNRDNMLVLLKDAVQQILIEQPEDPIRYLRSYFSEMYFKSNQQ